MSPLVESQSILSYILSQYGVAHPEDAIEDSLERLRAVVGVLPLTSQLLAGSCPVGLSIPVPFEGNTVGNAEACDLGVVEELKVEERNLFAIFPIGATIQDGGKRKEAMRGVWMAGSYIVEQQRKFIYCDPDLIDTALSSFFEEIFQCTDHDFNEWDGV